MTTTNTTPGAATVLPGPKQKAAAIVGIIVTAGFGVGGVVGVDVPDWLTADEVMAQYAAAAGAVTFVMSVIGWFVKDNGRAPSTQAALIAQGWTPPASTVTYTATRETSSVSDWFKESGPATIATGPVEFSRMPYRPGVFLEPDTDTQEPGLPVGAPPLGFHGV